MANNGLYIMINGDGTADVWNKRGAAPVSQHDSLREAIQGFAFSKETLIPIKVSAKNPNAKNIKRWLNRAVTFSNNVRIGLSV